METEYEATYWPIEANAMRTRLSEAGARLVHPNRLMRRRIFSVPGSTFDERWARVRDEGDQVTLSVKGLTGDAIDDQKETQLVIDDFERGAALLASIGCEEKAYQETKRERWALDGTEVTIDEWPFLEPLVEIEGSSEAEVRAVSTALGFSWGEARFCPVSRLYAERYGVTERYVFHQVPRIVFGEPNPFEAPDPDA